MQQTAHYFRVGELEDESHAAEFPRISRRAFVKIAGGALRNRRCLGLYTAVFACGQQSGGEAAILGSGLHTYEAIHGWAQVPEGMRFGNTHMVQEDSQGRILIHHQNSTPDSVFIFDPNGKFMKSWGAEWRIGAPRHAVVQKKATMNFCTWPRPSSIKWRKLRSTAKKCLCSIIPRMRKMRPAIVVTK